MINNIQQETQATHLYIPEVDPEGDGGVRLCPVHEGAEGALLVHGAGRPVGNRSGCRLVSLDLSLGKEVVWWPVILRGGPGAGGEGVMTGGGGRVCLPPRDSLLQDGPDYRT